MASSSAHTGATGTECPIWAPGARAASRKRSDDLEVPSNAGFEAALVRSIDDLPAVRQLLAQSDDGEHVVIFERLTRPHRQSLTRQLDVTGIRLRPFDDSDRRRGTSPGHVDESEAATGGGAGPCFAVSLGDARPQADDGERSNAHCKPELIWFAIWEGYGWATETFYRVSGDRPPGWQVRTRGRVRSRVADRSRRRLIGEALNRFRSSIYPTAATTSGTASGTLPRPSPNQALIGFRSPICGGPTTGDHSPPRAPILTGPTSQVARRLSPRHRGLPRSKRDRESGSSQNRFM